VFFLSQPRALPSARFVLFVTTVLMVSPLSAGAAQSVFGGPTYERPDLELDMPMAPQVRRPRPAVLPKGAAQAEKLVSEGRKPIGPLVIAVSIQRQNVKVYDSNGLFAESPISSGMAGHSTPMGVFSVIQKNKHHRSNIYSGAPMPYMQRITWSGIALHAGVLPGYPASHGCIRMPMSFAMKMWGWTRMGARVIVAPGEVLPVAFPHQGLAALDPPATLADAPAPSAVRTADARHAASVMTDVATGSLAAATDARSDVARVASTVAADATSDIPPQAGDTDGLPPIPSPAAVDFSDLRSGEDPQPLSAKAPETASAEMHEALETHPVTVVETTAAVSVRAAPEAAPEAAPAPQPAEPSAPPAPLIKRNLPVAMFVSRKDARIYVRQNFKPVLDLPIDISAADKPLGTHVFTASTGEDRAMRWSVVTLPATARQASEIREGQPKSRRSAPGSDLQVAHMPSAEEAMARIAIPQDLMSRLGEALPAGSSLVVSDQGIAQGETGEGTDFIVRLR
jgi:hypothetical protein